MAGTQRIGFVAEQCHGLVKKDRCHVDHVYSKDCVPDSFDSRNAGVSVTCSVYWRMDLLTETHGNKIIHV